MSQGTSVPSSRKICDYSSLSSQPFEVVAQSGKSYFIHSDILTAQSEPLRSTATGEWKEATEKKINLSDWDDDTVGRFIQFLYFGEYQVSKSTSEYYKGALVDVPPEVVGDALLVHAKLYALAQYKDIEGLKKMTLVRLKKALDDIDGSISKNASAETLATKVIELLEYIYTHTDSLSNSVEPMRDLVSDFAAKNFEALNQKKGMRSLLTKRSDIAAELVEKFTKRLFDAEEKVQEWRDKATVFQDKLSDSDELKEKIIVLEGRVQNYINHFGHYY